MEKWKEEIKTLESLRRNFRKFKKAKEDKDKEEMNKLSDKVDEIMEENKWVKMDWKKIKRGKAALEAVAAAPDMELACYRLFPAGCIAGVAV